MPLAIHDYKGDVFAVDNDLISILLEMRKQSIKSLELNEVDASSIKKNGVDVSLEPNGNRVNDHIYDFTQEITMFITNKLNK